MFLKSLTSPGTTFPILTMLLSACDFPPPQLFTISLFLCSPAELWTFRHFGFTDPASLQQIVWSYRFLNPSHFDETAEILKALKGSMTKAKGVIFYQTKKAVSLKSQVEKTLSLSLSLSIYLSIFFFSFFFVCLFVCLFVAIYITFYLSIFLSIHLSFCLSIYFSVYPTIFLSIYLFLYSFPP